MSRPLVHVEEQLVVGHASCGVEPKQVVHSFRFAIHHHVVHGVSIQKIVAIRGIAVIVQGVDATSHHDVVEGQVAGFPTLVSVFHFVSLVLNFNAFAGVAKQGVGDVST